MERKGSWTTHPVISWVAGVMAALIIACITGWTGHLAASVGILENERVDAAERLARIEAILERVEMKLDNLSRK